MLESLEGQLRAAHQFREDWELGLDGLHEVADVAEQQEPGNNRRCPAENKKFIIQRLKK